MTRVELETLGRIIARELINQRKPKAYISQNEAFRIYGRKRIEEWRTQGRLVPIKKGNRKVYRTKSIEALV